MSLMQCKATIISEHLRERCRVARCSAERDLGYHVAVERFHFDSVCEYLRCLEIELERWRVRLSARWNEEESVNSLKKERSGPVLHRFSELIRWDDFPFPTSDPWRSTEKIARSKFNFSPMTNLVFTSKMFDFTTRFVSLLESIDRITSSRHSRSNLKALNLLVSPSLQLGYDSRRGILTRSNW